MTIQLASEGAYATTPYVPSLEDGAIPDQWTPEHVARRLIEAFRIDGRLPRVAKPKAPGSAHPQMEYSDEEKAEWESIPYDPERAYPTPAEITTMEERFEWLYSVADTDVNASKALRAWALRQSSGSVRTGSGGSIRAMAKKLGLHHSTLQERKDRALSIIVSMLCDEGEPVF